MVDLIVGCDADTIGHQKGIVLLKLPLNFTRKYFSEINVPQGEADGVIR